MPNKDGDTWEHWSKLVLSEIKRLNKNVERLEDKSALNIVEISRLKIYAAISGFISGTIATILIKIVIERW